ncbi:hypothetical protein SCHPADRAFT_415624 [Schizopora paradoxa]|uniref:Uncharacterized protein n=1 Tax=Schizopora paradoxa TaxID=27342 RepID=A0A0H2RSV4_9AGAM|nr:hypothetical protein SCHPADRAFT_415624 [Schizopora paradoxa]
MFQSLTTLPSLRHSLAIRTTTMLKSLYFTLVVGLLASFTTAKPMQVYGTEGDRRAHINARHWEIDLKEI